MIRRILYFLPLLALLAAVHPGSAFTPTTGDLAGIIKDKQGKAIGNATVRVLAGPELGETRSDPQGRYRLANLDPGSYEILATKLGYVSVRKAAVVITANEATTLSFSLEWADPESGGAEILVEDRKRNRLPDATVELFSAGLQIERRTTDAIGSALFVGLVPGVYNAVIRRPGYRDGRTANLRVREKQVTAATVRLRRNRSQVGRLGGFVRDEEGAAIRGATLVLAGLTRGETRTNNQGQYQFNDLIPSGNYTLKVTASGFAPQDIGNIRVDVNQLASVNVTLLTNAPRKGSIAGLIRDSSGQPVPLASVKLTTGPEMGRRVTAGPDGIYTIQDLAPFSSYALVVEKPGYAAQGVAGVSVVAGRTTAVNVTLETRTEPPGEIEGIVREQGSGAPLEEVIVTVLGGPSAGLATQTDGAGHFSLDEVRPGENYILGFVRDGFVSRTESLIVVRSGSSTEVNVELVRRQVTTGTLQGLIEGDRVGPLSGARVTLFAGPSSPLQTTSDADGKYVFRNLRAGTGYSLRVQKQGWVTQERTRLTVRENQTTSAGFLLVRTSESGGLAGRVVDLLGRRVENARVRIVDGPSRPDDLRTDAAGEFLFPSLGRGTYVIEITANGFLTQQRSGIIVSPQSTTQVLIVLRQF